MLIAGCVHLPRKIKKKALFNLVNEIKKEFDDRVTVEINLSDNLIYYHQVVRREEIAF